jgi:hypothetical protein
VPNTYPEELATQARHEAVTVFPKPHVVRFGVAAAVKRGLALEDDTKPSLTELRAYLIATVFRLGEELLPKDPDRQAVDEVREMQSVGHAFSEYISAGRGPWVAVTNLNGESDLEFADGLYRLAPGSIAVFGAIDFDGAPREFSNTPRSDNVTTYALTSQQREKLF